MRPCDEGFNRGSKALTYCNSLCCFLNDSPVNWERRVSGGFQRLLNAVGASYRSITVIIGHMVAAAVAALTTSTPNLQDKLSVFHFDIVVCDGNGPVSRPVVVVVVGWMGAFRNCASRLPIALPLVGLFSLLRPSLDITRGDDRL